MPILYVLLDHGSFVHARAYGTLTTEDLVAHEEALLHDPELAHGYRQLLDCRWASDDRVNESALVQLAEVHSRNAAAVRRSRYAIVAHTWDWFQIGSHYSCGQYDMTLITFNDPITACIWLGMDYRRLASYRWPEAPAFVPDPSLWALVAPSA